VLFCFKKKQPSRFFFVIFVYSEIKTMKLTNRLIVSAYFTLLSLTNSYGQLPAVTLCLGVDDTICQGQTVNIQHCPSGGGGPSGGTTLTNPTNVLLSDDQWSGVIPMGFSFSFYGQNYTSCLIGSNCLISFNLASAGGFCPWVLNGTPLPTTTVPAGLNAAMGCYQDLNPVNAASGNIQYQTIGTAPNRQFIVLYKGITMFSCTQDCNYSAFIFYETSNIIEYHIGKKGECSNWNNNRAIQGTMNAAGSVAHVTPGRNNTTWTALNDGKRFTPTSPTNTNAYTISTIPYVGISSAGGASGQQWKSTLNQQWAYTPTLTIPNVPPGTTGYFLVGTVCGASVGTISDTTWITRITATVTASSTSDICGSGQGTVTATPGSGSQPFTYNWPALGQTTATVSGVATGSYTVNAADANGCPATATTTVANVISSSSSTTTQVSCPGGADGTATATMTPLGANTTYLWNDPLAQTTQTAIGLSAGTYTCTITSDNGCIEIVTVTITEIPAMVAVIANQVDVNCHSLNTGIINLSVVDGTAPYSYVWSGSSSTTGNANDLFVGPQSVTITDFNNCSVTLNTVLNEPSALYIDSMATDSMICSESSILIGAVGMGGSTPYIYTWYENGVQISTSQYVMVNPVNSGTQYTVVLSEVCGSPTDTDSLTLTFPTAIVPMVIPDPYEACAPYTFGFINTSVNGGDIATTTYDFSNGASQTVPLMDNVNQLFDVAGLYDVTMTVTSIHGCIYTATFPQIISALERPKAAFGMTTNPTTIFETTVGMIDKSIDVVSWYWNVPDGNPSFSTLQDPTFIFPSKEGNYEVNLTVTSSKGCVDSTKAILIVKSDVIIYAPNTFTPDGDQFNQNWKIVTDGFDGQDWDLEVFNRWGEIVWKSKDKDAEWDGTYAGTLVPQGLYNWKLRAKKNGSDEPRIITGSVMIIR
jgi:gliding motility-associated-like protein